MTLLRDNVKQTISTKFKKIANEFTKFAHHQTLVFNDKFKKNFKTVITHKLVNIYGESKIGGLAKIKSSFRIKQNTRQKKQNIIMLFF